MARLTQKQAVFVEEYFVDLNQTAAARRAGYSAKNAESIACQLMKKNQVMEAISERIRERMERKKISQDIVLDELAAIAKMEASDEPNSPLKYASKLRALELLGKHLGMFRERVQIEAQDGAHGVVLLAPVMDAVTPPEGTNT